MAQQARNFTMVAEDWNLPCRYVENRPTQGQVFPATLAAVPLQLLLLAVGALAFGADPDV
jgi:hypothetical protein